MGNAASGITLTQGNLKAAQASLTSDTAKTYSTIGLISGKWYVEVACSAANVYSGNGVVNVSQSSEGFDFSSSTNNVSVFSWGDRVYKNGSQTQSGVANAAGGSNILGIALNLDDGTVQLYSNGSTTGSAETLTRNTGDIFVFVMQQGLLVTLQLLRMSGTLVRTERILELKLLAAIQMVIV